MLNLKQAFDFLISRKHAYQRTFNGPQADIVLRDLARFCRAHDTTYHPEMSAVLEGRREVWLRISQHLKLSDDELWNLFDGRKLSD